MAATQTIEAAALKGRPAQSLMRRAGRAVARLTLAWAPSAGAGPIVVVAGSGNNGGDGWAAAIELKRAAQEVLVWEPCGCSAADALVLREQALQAQVATITTAPDDSVRPAVVIDALLGMGARGAIRSAHASAVAWMNAQAARGSVVISVDLPSGLDADTGQARCHEAAGAEVAAVVRADHTLSLLTLKPGLFTGDGRAYAGRLWFDDLGCAAEALQVPAQARLATGQSLSALLRSPRVDDRGRWRHSGHKGSHGDVWIVGGAPGMGGAAVLAARAALRAGAGRVHLLRLDGQAGDPGWPELMSAPLDSPMPAPLWASRTVVAGCGGGTDMAPRLPHLIHGAARLVLDADALNALAADATLQQRLPARRARGLPTILTPHPLEAARLLGCSTADVQANRLHACQTLADRLQCTVVLKGSGTVTATPRELPWINGSGNARLSTAGTGDVLAGWIGGAWSALTGDASRAASPPDAFGLAHRIAAACVELHGRAAGSSGRDASVVLSASELITQMALQAGAASHGDQG